jgi:hypothetical protein
MPTTTQRAKSSYARHNKTAAQKAEHRDSLPLLHWDIALTASEYLRHILSSIHSMSLSPTSMR